jgi:ABC-type nitrate/sulfonate/bicarbonate transport system substrate-binding protein
MHQKHIGISRRQALGGAAAGAVMALTSRGSRAQPGKLDVVKGTLSPLVSYAHIYSAVEKGIFAKHGIDNQIDSVPIPASLPLVARGEYDWGRSSNGPGYFNAVNSGLGIVGVVDRLTYICSADNALVASPKGYEAGLRSFTDLKGKTVGINAPGTATDYWLSVLLTKNNMKRSDIRVVTLGYPDLLAAISSGSADAGFMSEPLLTKAVLERKLSVIMPVSQIAPGDNIGVMFFGRNFIQKADGDLATRWLMAYLEGVRFVQDRANRDEVIRIVAKHTKVENEVLSSIYDKKDTWPSVEPNGRVDIEKMLKEQGQFFLQTKQVDKLPTPREVMDTTLLERALKRVGEVPVDKYLLCRA